MIRRSHPLLWGTVAALALTAGCRKPRLRPVIGFSQMANVGAWRIAETQSLRQEAHKRGYDLVVTDAQDSTAKQVADVEDLIARRVDAIFLAPREYEGLEPAFESALFAKIPVFLIDRLAAGRPGIDYVSFLGSDFVEQGRRAGRWLFDHTQGEVRIVELTGTPGSSVAKDRSEGFVAEIASHPRMRIIGSQTAGFVRIGALHVMENIIQGHGDQINAVYAHNDEMALGAIQALKAAGLQPGQKVTVVSIDGEKLALEAIVRGELAASVESNPRFGPLAFDALEKLRKGQPVPDRIVLQDRLFDSSNAAQFVSEAY